MATECWLLEKSADKFVTSNFVNVLLSQSASPYESTTWDGAPVSSQITITIRITSRTSASYGRRISIDVRCTGRWLVIGYAGRSFRTAATSGAANPSIHLHKIMVVRPLEKNKMKRTSCNKAKRLNRLSDKAKAWRLDEIPTQPPFSGHPRQTDITRH